MYIVHNIIIIIIHTCSVQILLITVPLFHLVRYLRFFILLGKLPEHINQLVHWGGQQTNRSLVGRLVRSAGVAVSGDKVLGSVEARGQLARVFDVDILLESREIIALFLRNVIGESVPELVEGGEEVGGRGSHLFELVEQVLDLLFWWLAVLEIHGVLRLDGSLPSDARHGPFRP